MTRSNENRSESTESRHFNGDIMSQYLGEIGDYDLLTKEDEAKLGQAIEAGIEAQTLLDTQIDALSPAEKRKVRALALQGAEAKQEFLHANLRLVVSIAKRYQGIEGIEQLDLIQEGYFGLDRAVDKFDWRKGFKFSTYATWWIHQSISRAISYKSGVIRVPIREQNLIRLVNRARIELESGQIEPTTAAIAEHLGWSEKAVTDALKDDSMGSPLSLSDHLVSDSEAELDDIISDPKSSADFENTDDVVALSPAIEAIQRVLTEEECQVVFERSGMDDGIPKTWNQVADNLGHNVHKAKRIDEKARGKLRHPSVGLRRILG